MFRVPIVLLYWLAVLTGVTGVLVEGIFLLKNWTERLFDPDYSPLLNSYDFFSSEVVFLLSLMLLITVHIGHALAGGLRFTMSAKSVSPENQTGVPPRTPAKQSSASSSASDPTTAAEVASVNEKLAHLVKPPTDKPEH